jgi:hypothetical protein
MPGHRVEPLPGHDVAVVADTPDIGNFLDGMAKSSEGWRDWRDSALANPDLSFVIDQMRSNAVNPRDTRSIEVQSAEIGVHLHGALDWLRFNPAPDHEFGDRLVEMFRELDRMLPVLGTFEKGAKGKWKAITRGLLEARTLLKRNRRLDERMESLRRQASF